VRILVTGACGFVGSTLIREWAAQRVQEIVGIDNFVRAGSELNRNTLSALGVSIRHGDVRLASDFEGLPRCDAVVDAAANPSVLAGVDGRTSSRQLVEHNLLGTINILEYCRTHGAAFVMLSTSRVYAIQSLAALPLRVLDDAFEPATGVKLPDGVTPEGINEDFPTSAPVSLYGSTKVASEQLAIEYGAAFGFPVWINRCGVLAGAGQFGRADQGIFSYWINSWVRNRPLKYIGFEGTGYQVRDCLHPADLVPLIDRQLAAGRADAPRVANVGGGRESARSLAQLSRWCRERISQRDVQRSQEERPFDLPWVVLDSRRAQAIWNWSPARSVDDILAEIVDHARTHPHWLDLSAQG
jgi:CDP-paratose 2-epimerase